MSSALRYISPCKSLSKEEQKETNDIQIYIYVYIHYFITVYYVNVYVFQIVSILFHTLCNAMFSSSLQYMAMAKVCLQLPPWQKWNNTMYIKHSNKRWVSPSWDSHAKNGPKEGTPVCKHWESIWDSEMGGEFGNVPRFTNFQEAKSAEQIGSCLLVGDGCAVEGHESPDMHVEMCRPWRLVSFK